MANVTGNAARIKNIKGRIGKWINTADVDAMPDKGEALRKLGIQAENPDLSLSEMDALAEQIGEYMAQHNIATGLTDIDKARLRLGDKADEVLAGADRKNPYLSEKQRQDILESEGRGEAAYRAQRKDRSDRYYSARNKRNTFVRDSLLHEGMMLPTKEELNEKFGQYWKEHQNDWETMPKPRYTPMNTKVQAEEARHLFGDEAAQISPEELYEKMGDARAASKKRGWKGEVASVYNQDLTPEQQRIINAKFGTAKNAAKLKAPSRHTPASSGLKLPVRDRDLTPGEELLRRLSVYGNDVGLDPELQAKILGIN